MPLTVRVDAETGIVHAEATGVLAMSELLTVLPELFASPDFQPGMAHLVDLTAAEDTTATADDLRAFVAEFQKEFDRIRTSRLAIVAENAVLFGMARMYETLAHPLPIPIRVLRDRDEAIVWLQEAPAS